MPVEIKELVIRAVAQKREPQRAPTSDSASSAKERDAIIELAVKEVLRILKASRER